MVHPFSKVNPLLPYQHSIVSILQMRVGIEVQKGRVISEQQGHKAPQSGFDSSQPASKCRLVPVLYPWKRHAILTVKLNL